jgi:type IV pilus assembly protein PilV
MEIDMKAMLDHRARKAGDDESDRQNGFAAPRRRQSGSMLIEVMVSILVFSMGVLALIGLQGVTVKYSTDAKFRVDAANLANQTLAQMWVDYANIPAYDFAVIGTGKPPSDMTLAASTVLPSGSRRVDVVPTALAASGFDVTVVVSWITPGATATTNNAAHNVVVTSHISP